MPRLKPSHRLTKFESLLDLANANLTGHNYRKHVCPWYPLDREDGQQLFDRSIKLAGQNVSLNSVAQLQRGVRRVLQLELAGWDSHRECDKSQPMVIPKADTILHRPLAWLGVRRSIGCKAEHIIDFSGDFIIHGRRPLHGINLRVYLLRQNVAGRATWILQEQDESFDLQDHWYRMACELVAVIREPTLRQSFSDRGPTHRATPLIRCADVKCGRFFFRNTKRQITCGRPCKDRPYHHRKRTAS